MPVVWRRLLAGLDALSRVFTVWLLIGGIVAFVSGVAAFQYPAAVAGVVAGLIAVGAGLLGYARQATKERPLTRNIELGERTTTIASRDATYRKMLAHLLTDGDYLLSRISRSARQSQIDAQTANKEPVETRQARFEALLLPRWQMMLEACRNWTDLCALLIENLYGPEEVALFKSNVGIPDQPPPDFEVSIASAEGRSFVDLQKRIYRLHSLIEKHMDKPTSEAPSRPLTDQEAKGFGNVLHRSIEGSSLLEFDKPVASEVSTEDRPS